MGIGFAMRYVVRPSHASLGVVTSRFNLKSEISNLRSLTPPAIPGCVSRRQRYISKRNHRKLDALCAEMAGNSA